MRGRARKSRITAGAGAVVALVTLAACSDGAGSVEKPTKVAPSYTALSLDSMKAHRGKAVDDAIAYSPDGTTAAVRGGSSICIVSSGSEDTSRVCPKLKTSVGAVAFSPDGDTAVVAEDVAKDFTGRLWLISTESGSVRQVPVPDGVSSKDEKATVYRAVVWPVDGDPLALVDVPGKSSISDHLVRINVDTAQPEDLAVIAKGDVAADGTMAATAHKVVFGASKAHDGASHLIVFDLDTKKLSQVEPSGALVTKGTRAAPVALSADGTHATLIMNNPAQFTVAPPVQVDLDSGAVTAVPGTADRQLVAAAYSPDGSQLALVTTPKSRTDELNLLVAPTSKGAARSLLTERIDPGVGFGLQWSGDNDLLPHFAPVGAIPTGFGPVKLSD